MRAVGLKELKNRLSEYVRIAARGERVLVTNHDRVVAELVPPEAGRALHVADAVLADLFKQVPLSDLLDDLASDREDR